MMSIVQAQTAFRLEPISNTFVIVVDRSFFRSLIFPSQCKVARMKDTSRPILVQNSNGCVTSFEWSVVNGQITITNGWSEYCKGFGLITGDVCVFSKTGCHLVRISVRDANGMQKNPLICHCTVGLAHNQVIIPASQRDLLAKSCLISMPRIPYFVFAYKSTGYLDGSLRICRTYAKKFLPRDSGWTKVFYSTEDEPTYVWRYVAVDRRMFLSTNWQKFARAHNMIVGSLYFCRFSVDGHNQVVCVVEELD
ncbi:hypothetical protein ACP70R_017627 [Stipagrostis hirtigluma subsp. patula]